MNVTTLDSKTKFTLNAEFGRSGTDLLKASTRALSNTKNHRNPHKNSQGEKIHHVKYDVTIDRIDIATKYLLQKGRDYYTNSPIDLKATYETAENDPFPPYGLSMNRFDSGLHFTPPNSVASIQSVYSIKRVTHGKDFDGESIRHLLPINPIDTADHTHYFTYQFNSFINTLNKFDHLTQVSNLITQLKLSRKMI
jgi:hypothetical protein